CRPGSSSGRKTQGGRGQETKAAHSPSRSPLAAGLSQDAPLEQTRNPGGDRHHYGRAFRFALKRFRNLEHPISEVGTNWRQPKNHHSKPGGERLWKRRSAEKSTKRTFPLRLEIRTHRGFPLYAQPRLLLEIKIPTTTKGDISIVLNKGTFLLSVDTGKDSVSTQAQFRVTISTSASEFPV